MRRRKMCDRHSMSVMENPGLSRRGTPLHLSVFLCTVCGEGYTPLAGNQKRCGKEECRRFKRRAGERAAHAKRLRPVGCDVCGVEFNSADARTKYCRKCLNIGISRSLNPETSRLYEARVSGDVDAIFRELKRRSRITDRGCWEWQGSVNQYGYGSVSKVHGVSVESATHRISLAAKLGHELGKMQAHHTCANSRCCNPDHLELATNAENQGEMRARKTYEARILELEQIIRGFDPNNPALRLHIGKGAA